MNNASSSQSFFVANLIKWAARALSRNRVAFFSAFVAGLLAHMYMFTNKLPNHDEVLSLFTKGASLLSGRWGIDILNWLIPSYSVPWLNGILTIVLLSVSACLIVQLFSVKNSLLQGLLAGSITVFPSLTGTFSYMFTSSTYGISFLLAVLAVWLLTRNKKGSSLGALVCMILSLSIYQSYIALAASFLVLILFQRLLTEREIAPVIKTGFCYVGFLIASLGLYFALTKLILLVCGTAFNDYTASNLTFSLSSVLSGVFQAYWVFLLTFLRRYWGLIPTPFSQAVHILCALASLALLWIWFRRNRDRKPGHYILMLALMAILPLAINCMYLFTASESIHTLVLYGFIAVYIFFTILADHHICQIGSGEVRCKAKNAALNILTGGMALIIVCNIFVANRLYLQMQMRYENSYAFYTSLLADLRQMPEFTGNVKLAVIGEYDEPDFYSKFGIINVAGSGGITPDSYSMDYFMEYYLGLPIRMASETEIAAIMETQAYQNMAVYPYYGSSAIINETLVVRLS